MKSSRRVLGGVVFILLITFPQLHGLDSWKQKLSWKGVNLSPSLYLQVLSHLKIFLQTFVAHQSILQVYTVMHIMFTDTCRLIGNTI